MTDNQLLENQIEANTRIILAAESWSHQYELDVDTHAEIIRIEARMERLLRRYFIDLSDRAKNYIDWFAYQSKVYEVQAADNFRVDVFIKDDEFSRTEDGLFMNVIFKPINDSVSTGARAAQEIYGIDMGMSSVDNMIQKTSKQQVASLVGKRVQDGIIVDNPKAKYRVNDKTRADIAESIRTSISLGEDQNAAVARLRSVIRDPKRAGVIARTEAVNAYQAGSFEYAKLAGAIGKVWENVGATDICATNSNAGPIEINSSFPSGDLYPVAHPNCRCSNRYIFPESPEAKQLNFGKTATFVDRVQNLDLEKIAQGAVVRPNSDVNTKIEELLKLNNPEALLESIRLAKTLPKESAISMLRSINYNGVYVANDYYTVKIIKGKGLATVLKPGVDDPLKLSPEDLARRVGIKI